MYTIQLIEKEELGIIIPLLKTLDNSLHEELLQHRLEEMKQLNYLCVSVFDGKQLVGISGLWMLNKYYAGKHIEPDNVVILPDYRDKGIGEQLMQWIHNYAKEQGCLGSELNCYVSNSKGVAFWIKQGYRILGFHFRKDL